jgi:RHS repeat-associated protein
VWKSRLRPGRWGSDLSSPHWLHTDQQGSVIAATDSGAAATPYAYSATGEPKGGWSSSAPAFRYTGQVAIASASLYFYKARMYDPALGRFLQTDPVGYQAGMNLCAYVQNNFPNAAESSGLLCNQADQTGCGGNPYGLAGGRPGRRARLRLAARHK